MLVSTRGRYALRVMADLAKHNNGKYIPMREVAARQDISLKYLEKILPILKNAGLIEGIHGNGGGYKLVKDAADYTLLEILKLTENELAPVTCLCKDSECKRSSFCNTLPVWQNFHALTKEYFENIKLTDIM